MTRWMRLLLVPVMLCGFAWVLSTPASASGPCGVTGTPPPVRHVIVVMLENKSYTQVVGSPNAPYETALARQCGVAPVYFGATHTSAANYLATSGGKFPSVSLPGCSSVSGCADPSNSLYHQLKSAGLSWKAYEEAMPSNCYPKNYGTNSSSHSLYINGHNPPLFFTGISSADCQAFDVAVPDLTAASGPFWEDMQNQALPSFSWVTPDGADNGEGPFSKAVDEQKADTWLQNFLARVTASPSYGAGNTLVLITYDEGSGTDRYTGEDCTDVALDLPVTNGMSARQDSCHVPLFIVYPYTPAGTSDSRFFDHYSITKTVEDLFGLPYLAHAGDPETTSLVGHFGIRGMTTANTAPIVGFSRPKTYSTVSGTITATGIAEPQNGAKITGVRVSVDGSTPITATGTTSWSAAIATTRLANGTHAITAAATDSKGKVGRASVIVTVSN